MQDDSNHPLPSPWKEFLSDLDDLLTDSIGLHCIGGFVICFFYGLPRTTGDIDYWTAIPSNVNLDEIAGEGSDLAKKHKVCLHRSVVNSMPEDYVERLTEMFPDRFQRLHLFAPDPYHYILSKIERNSMKDRDDAEYLFRTQNLDSDRLRSRYEKELRPYLADETKHDLTLRLWTDIFEASS
jgi:Nucleotidyltransferase of unknown function (DUF6036)